MAILSKLNQPNIPYNCYEIIHTWHPDCNTASLVLFGNILLEGFKVYSRLFVISQILQKKFSLRDFLHTIQNIYTSTTFLAMNGFLFMMFSCWYRKLMGGIFHFHSAYVPALVASFLAIFIERKNRRSALALYMTNLATESLIRMGLQRNLIKPFPNAETYLFSATMAGFLYLIKKNGYSKDIVSSIFRIILGKDEAKSNNKTVRVGGQHELIPEVVPPSKLMSKPTPFRLSAKHNSCQHQSSCISYCLKGFLRPFLISYLASTAIRCVAMSKQLLHSPAYLLLALADKRSIKLGLFLGGFSGTFKAVNCLLRWMVGKDNALYAIPGALLGGLFMKFYPSSTISLYLMWKLIENRVLFGVEKGVIPHISCSTELLYAFSMALLFHVLVFEAHNLKPAYLKFLSQVTHNKIGKFNRHLLELFGTQASKKYTDFWPPLDYRYTSLAFQETLMPWLIH